MKPADRNQQKRYSRMRPAWEEVERRAAILGGTEEAMLSVDQLKLDFSVLSALLTKLQIRSKQIDIWVDTKEFPAVKAFADQMRTNDVDQSEADIIYFLNAAEVELEGKRCDVAAGLRNRLLAAIIQAAPHQSSFAFNKRVLQAIEGREDSLPAVSFLNYNEVVVPRAELKSAFVAGSAVASNEAECLLKLSIRESRMSRLCARRSACADRARMRTMVCILAGLKH